MPLSTYERAACALPLLWLWGVALQSPETTKAHPSVLRKWALIRTLCTTDRVDLAPPPPPVSPQQQTQQQRQQQQQHRPEEMDADMEIINSVPEVDGVITSRMCARYH